MPQLTTRLVLTSSLIAGALTLTGCAGTTSTVTQPTAATKPALTASEVAKHNSDADCWAIVDRNVYDLTSWVKQHPGGADKITAICGKDGSDLFRGKHGSSKDDKLKSFLLGPLAG